MIISPPPQHNGNCSTHRHPRNRPSPSSSPPLFPLSLLAHAFPIGDLTNVSGSTIKSNGGTADDDDDATQLAPHTKDKGGGGGRPLWGGGGGLQRWRWRGSWPHHREGEGREEGRISPIHHKKSRNLMSNFAQHRVRPHFSPSPRSTFPPPFCRKSKIKVSSSCALSREEKKGRGDLFRDKLCPSGATAAAETISCREREGETTHPLYAPSSAPL